MSDIVERLLAKPPSLGFEDHDPTFDDRMDAAKEIKRLRKKLAFLYEEGSARNVTLEEAAKVADHYEPNRTLGSLSVYGGTDAKQKIAAAIRALKEGVKT